MQHITTTDEFLIFFLALVLRNPLRPRHPRWPSAADYSVWIHHIYFRVLNPSLRQVACGLALSLGWNAYLATIYINNAAWLIRHSFPCFGVPHFDIASVPRFIKKLNGWENVIYSTRVASVVKPFDTTVIKLRRTCERLDRGFSSFSRWSSGIELDALSANGRLY